MTRLELATSTLGRPWTPWRRRMRPFVAAWRGGPSGWLMRGLSTAAGAGEGHAGVEPCRLRGQLTKLTQGAQSDAPR